MQLVLSTAAAVDFTLEELLSGCARRGLAGLELVSGHAHGVSPGIPASDLEAFARRALAHGAPLVGFRAPWQEAGTLRAARLSRALGAPIVSVPPKEEATVRADTTVPEEVTPHEDAPDRGVAATIEAYARARGTLLLVHGTDPEEAGRLRRLAEAAPAGSCGLAWEVEPAAGDLTEHVAAVLEAAGSHLMHIRLLGGGPESPQHEGRGIGALMARLTLAGYRGSIALAPSTPAYHVLWRTWLGRRGGWGCGSKTSDPTLVQLDISNR
jgi:sugar phosphate isomerase/epimerase